MPFGAPSTLWKHTGFELLKLVVMTAAVLVTIIAFAASVRWVAEGKLGPIEMLRFVALAMVPMLAYALPFAAGFAATLTFHRMASDNEVTATHAGGISHSRVLVPAMAVGLFLAGSLGVLNEQVIPRFLRNMEEMITEDLSSVVLGSIRNGESLVLDDFVVSADSVIRVDPSTNDAVEASGASDWLVMNRFMAIQRDENGAIVSETTAREAHLFYFPHNRGEASETATPSGSILLHLVDSVAVADGQLASFEKSRLPPIDVPVSFSDDPKFLTYGELRELRDDPDSMSFVDSRRRSLARALAREQIVDRVNNSLRATGGLALVAESGDVTLFGRDLRWVEAERCWEVLPAGDRVELIAPDPSAGPSAGPGAASGDNAQPVTHSAERATLHLDSDAGRTGDGLAIRVEMLNVSRADGSGPAGDRRRILFSDLTLPDDPLSELLAKPSVELLAIDRSRNAGELSGYGRTLSDRIDRMHREVLSKQHERMAMAVSCFVMTLCGSIIALRLRDALPLTVYLWSFFPALGCVISISSGQSQVHDSGWIGLPLLWGGVLGLAVYTLVSFRKLARH